MASPSKIKSSKDDKAWIVESNRRAMLLKSNGKISLSSTSKSKLDDKAWIRKSPEINVKNTTPQEQLRDDYGSASTPPTDEQQLALDESFDSDLEDDSLISDGIAHRVGDERKTSCLCFQFCFSSWCWRKY